MNKLYLVNESVDPVQKTGMNDLLKNETDSFLKQLTNAIIWIIPTVGEDFHGIMM